MLKEIQQEILSLRKTLSELKIGFKEMKEQIKLKHSDEKHKNTLMIEMMRKIIENGVYMCSRNQRSQSAYY